jgi:DNA-binding NarL/FixJ family response regulator
MRWKKSAALEKDVAEIGKPAVLFDSRRMKTRVLIVDDHQIVREGLKALLECDEQVEIVGEAADGNEAVRKAQESKPDVVIMDVAMPVMNGRVAATKIRQNLPNAKIVVLSSYYDDDCVREMVFAGAAGYLVKQSCGNEVLQAIHAARKGESTFSRCIMERFRHEKQREHITGRTGRGATALTDREREVLGLIAQGLPNKGTADELGISIKTVEKHRQAIMEKLNIHEAAGLTRYALQKGLVSCDSGRNGAGKAATAVEQPNLLRAKRVGGI